ncbi:hypothetical protein KO500_01645 [Cellulophaga baltica]|uniref:DUF4350 domain-containing protein n=1 Tax=Cellulophaga TaxID=104264 RepID=UPI001C067F6E|nr:MULTISPECIES: DUF4350 domain-containing protein [Cellulophaga]MBU2995113.1 hypothetical protein [Cellulophaga baltica]MDO6766508.1 hypothetical protein [Cellulophaga sp. 1_MG-2023]
MRKKTIFIIIGVVVVSILLFLNQGNELDWTPAFNENETKPLDTKVFYDQLPFYFKGKSAKKIYTTFYEYDQHLRMQEKDTLKNYVSVSGSYDIDDTSFNSLLQYVDYGNEAFISAYYFPKYMQDTLHFKVEYDPVELKQEDKTLYLFHSKDSLKYSPKVPYGTSYISDSIMEGKRLGYLKSYDNKDHANFIGVPYGNGIFYIHTSPEVFTNYQMLQAENTGYVSNVISFLPTLPILVDKAVKLDPEISSSPLRYILSKEPLRWGWYLLLLAIGLFMLFNAKRRQRIIPIKNPLKNTTTEFVQTVSNLHYEAEDYNGVIQKMIVHFLEHVRSKYHLSTDKLNEDFVTKLALRSGKPLEEIQQLVSLVIKMKSHQFSTKEPLKALNKEIEKFYKQ